MRPDGRALDQLRAVRIERGYLRYAEGSALIDMGNTRVLCAATMENSVPDHLKGTGKGWVTAEYSMLPRSSPQRVRRESVSGRIGGRTHEIMRLIGRGMRAVVDCRLWANAPWCWTATSFKPTAARTASITGAAVALHDAGEAESAAPSHAGTGGRGRVGLHEARRGSTWTIARTPPPAPT
jgi:ribonuclease PH